MNDYYEGHMIWSNPKPNRTIQERFDESKKLHDKTRKETSTVLVWPDCPEFETTLEVIKAHYILVNHFWFVEQINEN